MFTYILVIMIGGSFIKSVITGTVAKETNEFNRAKGFSIFYMMVNIGGFIGPAFSSTLRTQYGWKIVFVQASVVIFINLLLVIFLLLLMVTPN